MERADTLQGGGVSVVLLPRFALRQPSDNVMVID